MNARTVTDYPRITSRQNPLVGRFRDAAGGDAAIALLDGEHLVRDALAAGTALDIVAVAEDRLAGPLGALAARAAASGAVVVAVTPSVLDAISPVRQPTGIAALAHLVPAPLDHVMAGPAPLLAVLDGVQDAGNVGAIVRAAEAFGVTGIVCTAGTADPFGWKALRGSMGSALRLPVAARQPVDATLRALRERGVRLLAAVPRGGTPLPRAQLTGPVAVVLGGEGGGVTADVIAMLDDGVTIPMAAAIESLNVAVAAALIFYEASRQRSPI